MAPWSLWPMRSMSRWPWSLGRCLRTGDWSWWSLIRKHRKSMMRFWTVLILWNIDALIWWVWWLFWIYIYIYIIYIHIYIYMGAIYVYTVVPCDILWETAIWTPSTVWKPWKNDKTNSWSTELFEQLGPSKCLDLLPCRDPFGTFRRTCQECTCAWGPTHNSGRPRSEPTPSTAMAWFIPWLGCFFSCWSSGFF